MPWMILKWVNKASWVLRTHRPSVVWLPYPCSPQEEMKVVFSDLRKKERKKGRFYLDSAQIFRETASESLRKASIYEQGLHTLCLAHPAEEGSRWRKGAGTLSSKCIFMLPRLCLRVLGFPCDKRAGCYGDQVAGMSIRKTVMKGLVQFRKTRKWGTP